MIILLQSWAYWPYNEQMPPSALTSAISSKNLKPLPVILYFVMSGSFASMPAFSMSWRIFES